MADIRFSDKPQLTALDGDEVIPGTSTNGGTDTASNAVAAGSDIRTTVKQLLAWILGKSRASSALSIVSGVVTIDLSLGDYFTCELTANVTSIAYTNGPSSGGRSIAIRWHQDSTGGRTVAQPSSHKAITGSDTAVQSAASAYTIQMLTTFDAGTRWEYSMKAGTA